MGRKKSTKQNRDTFVKGLLRRGTYSWKARNECLKNARVDRGQYQCAACEGTFKQKEVQVDHILPVVDPKTGFVSWDEYIARMFPDLEHFQVLCTQCHDAKTKREDVLREIYKKERKELDKEDEDE